jgi:hypothetical protein
MKKLIRAIIGIIMYSVEICMAVLLFVVGIFIIMFSSIFSKNDREEKE